MSEEKTPGQVSWTARNMALAGPGEQPGDVLAELGHVWDHLYPDQREAEEIGAQAALDNRTPWGDVNITVIATGPRCAVVSSGPDGDVVKVIAYGDTGLAYYDSVEEWQRANAGPSDDFAMDRPDRHADLDAGENGGAMTDADFYDRVADGERAGQESEAERHARDMAAEDGDLDDCEPTL